MEPGVPFALLGSVQLLVVAAWAGLAATVVAMRRARGATWLVAAGALVLVAVEVRTALRFGHPVADDLMLVRAAGALLIAAGIAGGALASRVAALASPPLLAVVVPLGAAPAPAAVAAACTIVAAAAALRSRSDLPGQLLAAGLTTAAVGAALGPLARHSAGGALALVGVRGLAAALLLAALVALARASLLAKVVAAIIAGVLAMAAAAVGVVGTVVVSSYQQQAGTLVAEAAEERVAALNATTASAQVLVKIAAAGCTTRTSCRQVLEQLTSDEASSDFVAVVRRNGPPQSLGGRAELTPAELITLSREPSVRSVLAPDGPVNEPVTARVRLVAARPSLALVAVYLPGIATSRTRPTTAYIYGIRLDNRYVANDVSSYGLSVLVDGEVVSSNLSAADAEVIDTIAEEHAVRNGLPDEGLTVAAEGSRPTVRFAPLTANDGHALGALVLSRDASLALGAQRDALQALFITALLATGIVGLVAILLGRRTVEPVRQLTAAAQRVARGDLSATAAVRSPDEVGTLSRTFDAMTASLTRVTGDLRSSADRLETVLASMTDGLVATDAAGRVTSVNRAALDLVGRAADEVVGRPVTEVFDVRDAAGVPLTDLSLRLSDAPGEVLAPDGRRTPVRVALGPLAGGEGVVLVLRDTTREREVERMKTEFLSNVSHELRTPLTPIRGYADMLARKSGLTPAQVAQFAGTIRDESVRMGRVVDLLVDVAALEAGRISVEPRPVSVRALLDDRLAAWRERAPARAGDLRRRVAAGLPAANVDPAWVTKALDELIDNAVKHTPGGTPITLAAELSQDGTSVRVMVRDRGPGIAEEAQAGLFTSFEQVDGSATRHVGGLGLGLSFVRRLADDAGFPLSFSTALGKGSEFWLDLPVADEPPVSRGSRAGQRRAKARSRTR